MFNLLLFQFSVQGLCIEVSAGFVQMDFYDSSTQKNGMNSSSGPWRVSSAFELLLPSANGV